MLTPALDEKSRKTILFDVLDGIPAKEGESEAATIFRKGIEHDDFNLKIEAEELGIEDPLIEFSSGCEL